MYAVRIYPNTSVPDLEVHHGSLADAMERFHKEVGAVIHDTTTTVILSAGYGQGWTELASKSRGQHHVEITQAYYRLLGDN